MMGSRLIPPLRPLTRTLNLSYIEDIANLKKSNDLKTIKAPPADYPALRDSASDRLIFGCSVRRFDRRMCYLAAPLSRFAGKPADFLRLVFNRIRFNAQITPLGIIPGYHPSRPCRLAVDDSADGGGYFAKASIPPR